MSVSSEFATPKRSRQSGGKSHVIVLSLTEKTLCKLRENLYIWTVRDGRKSYDKLLSVERPLLFGRSYENFTQTPGLVRIINVSADVCSVGAAFAGEGAV
jgi:hypothetical protein